MGTRYSLIYLCVIVLPEITSSNKRDYADQVVCKNIQEGVLARFCISYLFESMLCHCRLMHFSMVLGCDSMLYAQLIGGLVVYILVFADWSCALIIVTSLANYGQ